MNDPKKDCAYYESKLAELNKRHLDTVYSTMVAAGASKEQIIKALRDAVQNQQVQMITAGQESSTN